MPTTPCSVCHQTTTHDRFCPRQPGAFPDGTGPQCQHPEEVETGDVDNDGGILVRCTTCGLVSNTGRED